MNNAKYTRALRHYNGHKGETTIAHVQRNIETTYPTAAAELTGRQYGLVMSVSNTSYHDGAADATRNGDMWAFDNLTDWVAGIGRREPDGKGGVRNQGVIEVKDDAITITSFDGQVVTYKRV